MTAPTTATHGTIAQRFGPSALGALRVAASALFILHGTQKLFHWPVDPTGPAGPTIALASLPGAAGVIELVGGTLVLFGLFTRPVAFLLSGEMAAAYFLAHAPQNLFPILNRGELPVLFCFIFLAISALGPGAASADGLRHRR